ncbi:hypothetical protein NKH77_23420 [Streptomyces sp. M19]
MPWLMALMPLVTAVVMVMVFGRWYYMIMAVMSPMMMVANYFMDRKNGRKSHAREVKEYKEHKARIEKDAQDALLAERLDRRLAVPDPAAVLALGTGPRTRLWERRRTDHDHLLLRVGTAELPSEVVLDDPEQDDHRREVTWTIDDAPVTLPLRTLGVVGVAGPGDSARALGRWAVSQTATLHSPMDVQFFVLTESVAEDSWSWTRWLPHARPPGGFDTNVLIGTDAETVSARVGELTQLLDARQKAAKQQQGRPRRSATPTSWWCGTAPGGCVRSPVSYGCCARAPRCPSTRCAWTPRSGSCPGVPGRRRRRAAPRGVRRPGRRPRRRGGPGGGFASAAVPGGAPRPAHPRPAASRPSRRGTPPAPRRAARPGRDGRDHAAAARGAGGRGPAAERTARLRLRRLVRAARARPVPAARHQRRDRGLGAARRQQAAGRHRTGAADGRGGRGTLAHGRPVDDGGDRRVVRRPVRHRHAAGRSARPHRRYHRFR